MKPKTPAYSEGTRAAAFACMLPALLLPFRRAHQRGLCSISIAVGLVTVWSCISDDTSTVMKSLKGQGKGLHLCH